MPTKHYQARLLSYPKRGLLSILLSENISPKIPANRLEKFITFRSLGFIKGSRTVHLLVQFPNYKALLGTLRPCHTESLPRPGEENRRRSRKRRHVGVGAALCGGRPQGESAGASLFLSWGRGGAGRAAGGWSSRPSTLSP